MTADTLPPIQYQPAPPWVRVLAWATVGVSLLLVALGGFVTTFRAGMADQVWPTEPWFLFSNKDWHFAFVIEHSHRLAGWIVGLLATGLALAVWRTEPDRKLRILGFVALAALLVSYAEFHRGFRGSYEQIKLLAKTDLAIDAAQQGVDAAVRDPRTLSKVSWPWIAIVLTLATAAFAVFCAVRAGLAGKPGGWLRALAVVGLVAVMVQGVLGGFRVLLNPLMGTDLATIHGAFGQLTFCTLVAVAVLCTPRRFGDSLAPSDSPPFAKLAWILVGTLVIQLVWAVMLRHTGGGFAQRLHLLTAFVASGLLVWLCVRVLTTSGARHIFGSGAWLLLVLLAWQLLFGVEAYLGKFAAMGAQSQVLPEYRSVGRGQAVIRTAHQVVGCILLASAVGFAIRLGRLPAMHIYQQNLREGAVPDVAAYAMMLGGGHTPREGAIPDVALMALTPPDDGTPMEQNIPDVATMAMNPPTGGLLR